MARNIKAIGASGIRNAMAAQAAFHNHGAIARGAFAVRAQAGADPLMAVVKDGLAGITDAQLKQNERLDKIEADAALYQAGVDKLTVQAAGGIFAGAAEDKDTPAQPIHASAGLRGKQIGAHYRQRAQAESHGAFNPAANTNLADFMRAVAGLPASDFAKASLSVGTDSAGGYAVPGIVMPGILDAMSEKSALLAAGASVLPVDRGAKNVTTAAIQSLPKPAWRKELGALAVSEPNFRQVVATPKSLSAIVRVSRELLMDADDLPRALMQAIGQAYALEFDRAALVGSGVDPEPLGLYGMADINKVQQVGSAFSYKDVLAAYQAQLESSAPAPTSIILAPRTLVGLAGLVDTLGQPLNAPPLLDGVVRRSSNGVPVNLGDSADKSLAFIGDFSTVQFVLRERLSFQRLSEAYVGTGEIGFACHARVDVVSNYPQSITVIEGVTS